MTTFGIIGAGHIGSAVAAAVIGLGHDVVIANSRGPETLTELIAELGEHARAATASEAGEAGEVIVVTVPFKAVPDIPVEPLAGKIVIDTNNYYFERDGRNEALDRGEATVSGLLQQQLPTSRVVKAFNSIGAREIGTTGFVIGLLDQLGFDAVDVSPLSESWRYERDRPAYGIRQNRDELVANLAKAPRTL